MATNPQIESATSEDRTVGRLRRYLILRTRSWDDAVIEAVRRELEQPSWDEDTMARRLRKELR